MKTIFTLSVLPFVVLLFYLTVITSIQADDPRENMGLVSLWTLDKDTIHVGKIEDVFGDNTGTIIGKPEHIDGFRGDAFKFDGAVDFIRMGKDIIFPSLTVEAIIKPTLGTRNPIYDKYNYGVQLLENNNVGIWIRANTPVQVNHWPSAYVPYPADGEWHHVVGVVENKKEVRIYIDGELKKKTPAPDPINVAYGAALRPTIAYTQHLGGIWYEGAIDEVAVFEVALGNADVRKLYTQALSTLQPTGKIAMIWATLKMVD